MILAVTPNAAIDRTVFVERLQPGQVHRAWRVEAGCGGKGINVARAARDLDAVVRCAGLLGGQAGRAIADGVAAAQIDAEWTWVAGESRTCLIFVERAGQGTTVINEPGPDVAAAEWRRLAQTVQRQAPLARVVCLCGSVPPGAPADGLAQLVEAAGNTPTWVDSSGPALAEVVAACPAGVKINAGEAAELLGDEVDEPQQALAAAEALRRKGVGSVAITLGSRGAVLATAGGRWHAAAPTVAAVNPVGSGDAFLAGLLVAIVEGAPPPRCLARATAAGTAAALQPVGPRVARADFERLLATVQIAAG